MIRKSGGSFIGCSKMARCKAPDSPRTEAYSRTPQGRGVRETQQMAVLGALSRTAGRPGKE